jgi:trigger factor
VEVNIQNLSEVSREIEMKATPEELQPHFNKAYDQYRKKVEIRGFRKGKAPIEIIKKLYGDLIEQEALESIASDFYRQAIKEKDLKPIGEPVLVDMDFKRESGVTFKIRYDIRPQIVLKDYKGIEIEKIVHPVTDKDVEEEVLRLRRSNASFQEVDAAADEEHVVTVDMQDLDESGSPIAGKRRDSVRLYLADENLESPFKSALKKAQKGGVYKVEFEHEHEDHKHTVREELTVTKVEKILVPELDPALIEKMTNNKEMSVEGFRADIRKDLEEYWKQQTERQVINSLTEEIIKRHDFQVPESLIRNVLDGLLEEMKNEYPNKNLPADFDVEKFNEQNRPYAEYQSKWALLREELIKAEAIAATDEDLETLAEKEADRIKIPKERLVNYYKSSDQIKDRIVSDKLLKILTDAAKIKEVTEKEAKAGSKKAI